MYVRPYRTSNGQPIGAGLLLPNPPLGVDSLRTCQIGTNYVRPKDSRFDFQQPSLLIEAPNAGKATHVEQRASIQKLLAPHRVPPAGNGQARPFRAASSDKAHHVFHRPRFEDA